MYVCLCNALTDRDVKRATSDHGAVRPAEVYEACGCRAQCGRCVQLMLSLLRNTHGAETGAAARAVMSPA